MARVTKSLQAPEQGYRHRDHRSQKGRSQSKSKYKRKVSVAFKTKKQTEAELAKLNEADLYEIQMIPIRNRWRNEKW
jgi:hypothetical protein